MRIRSKNSLSVQEVTFEVAVTEAHIAIRFQAEFFLEWRTINNKSNVKSQGRKKAVNSAIRFDEAIRMNTYMLCEEDRALFLRKQSFILVQLVTSSKSNEVKLVGRLSLDLADIANLGTYTTTSSYPLDFCSLDSKIFLSAKMVASKPSTLVFHELDQLEFGLSLEYLKKQSKLATNQHESNQRQAGSNKGTTALNERANHSANQHSNQKEQEPSVQPFPAAESLSNSLTDAQRPLTYLPQLQFFQPARSNIDNFDIPNQKQLGRDAQVLQIPSKAQQLAHIVACDNEASKTESRQSTNQSRQTNKAQLIQQQSQSGLSHSARTHQTSQTDLVHSQIASMTAFIDQLSQELQLAKVFTTTATAQLQAQCQSLAIRVQQLQQRQGKLQAENKHYKEQQRISEMRLNEMQEVHQENALISRYNQLLTEQLAALQDKLQVQLQNIDQKDQLIGQLNQELSQAQSNPNPDFAEAFARVKAELQSSLSQCKDLNGLLDQKQAILSQCKLKQNKNLAAMQDYRDKFEDATRELLVVKNQANFAAYSHSRLKESYDQLVESLRSQIQQLQQAKNVHLQQTVSLRVNLFKLEEDIATVKMSLAEKQLKQLEYETQIDQLKIKNKLNNQHSSQISTLQAETARLKTQVEVSEFEINRLKAELATHEILNSKLKSEITVHEANIDKLNGMIERNNLEREESAKSMNSVNGELKLDNETLSEKLKCEREQHSAEVAGLVSEKEQIVQSVRQLEQEKNQLMEVYALKFASLKDEYVRASQLDTMQPDPRHTTQFQSRKNSDANENISERIRDYEEQISKYAMRERSLRENLKLVEQQFENIFNLVAEKEENEERLAGELAELRESYSAVCIENEELFSAVETFKLQCSKFQRQVEEYSAEREGQDKANDHELRLTIELEACKDELTELVDEFEKVKTDYEEVSLRLAECQRKEESNVRSDSSKVLLEYTENMIELAKCRQEFKRVQKANKQLQENMRFCEREIKIFQEKNLSLEEEIETLMNDYNELNDKYQQIIDEKNEREIRKYAQVKSMSLMALEIYCPPQRSQRFEQADTHSEQFKQSEMELRRFEGEDIEFKQSEDQEMEFNELINQIKSIKQENHQLKIIMKDRPATAESPIAETERYLQQWMQILDKRQCSLELETAIRLLVNRNETQEELQSRFVCQKVQIVQKSRQLSKQIQKVKSSIMKSQNRNLADKSQLIQLMRPCEAIISQIVISAEILSEREPEMLDPDALD